ncbi:MAG: proton-conducting transporter membrane subunit [Bacillota bacterium]
MPQETISSLVPVFIILIPLLAGVAVFLSGIKVSKVFSREYDGLLDVDGETAPPQGNLLRVGVLLGATLASLILSLSLYPAVKAGLVVVSRIDILPPLGLFLRVDILSFYMVLLFSFFGFILTLYSIGYMKGDTMPQRFFGFLMLVFAGSLGVVLGGDLFSFFLFFEFMSIMYFVLVVHDPKPTAVAAGMKFLFMTIMAGVALFLGTVIVFRETGSMALSETGLFSGVTTYSLIAFIAFMVAFGTKTAMFPLHIWMPDTYTHAPLPAAVVSSAIMLKTGAYGFIRVFYNVFGVEFFQAVRWDDVVLVISLFTIVFGSAIAIAQDDIIRRLAYSGIAQLGYIILGIVILTPTALTGSTFHIMAHAFMKGCLFLCAGSIIMQTGNRSIRLMKGIGYQLPLTMLAFAVAAITAVGMPPFNIFITKWHLSIGALEIGQPVIILFLLVSSMLNAAYYLPIAYHAFLGSEDEAHGGHGYHPEFKRSAFREPTAAMLVPILILMVGCAIFGFFTQNWPLEIVRSVVAMLY